MPKLMDRIIAYFFDSPEEGYMSKSKGIGNNKWMFARCSSVADGYLPTVSLPEEVKDECYLAGIDYQRIPLWWVERKFIKAIMARMKGFDVIELVPENTVRFERKMATRANMTGGVLVYITTNEGPIKCVSPCAWIRDGISIGKKVDKVFNKHLDVESVMISFPLNDPAFLKVFFRSFDRLCNQVAQSIVNLDK